MLSFASYVCYNGKNIKVNYSEIVVVIIQNIKSILHVINVDNVMYIKHNKLNKIIHKNIFQI